MTELKVLLNWLDINAYPAQYAQFIDIEKELEQLRKEKETWLKVCKYEYKRWYKWITISGEDFEPEEKDHVNNLNELLGE